MARLGTNGANRALNGLDGVGSTNAVTHVTLHVSDPGTTGAGENANVGSYARQACTWNVAAAAAKTNSTALTFSTLGTIAVTHFGAWDLVTYAGGNYGIGGALAASVTAASITVAAGALSIAAS